MEGALLAKNLLIELSHGGDELRAHAGLYVQLEVFGPLLFEFFLELCIAFSHDGYLHSDFGFLDDRNQMGWGTAAGTEGLMDPRNEYKKSRSPEDYGIRIV